MKLKSSSNGLSLSALTAIGLLTTASIQAQEPAYPVNNGFELPDLGSEPAKSYKYWNELSKEQAATLGWTFTGSSGIAANNSFFNTVGAENGNSDSTKSAAGQAAFVTGTSTVAQSCKALPEGKITIAFALEGRSTDAKKNPVELLVDGAVVDTYTPETTDKFTEIKASTTITAGAHTITFRGTVGGSEPMPTTFVDQVSIEPAGTGTSTPSTKAASMPKASPAKRK